MKLFFLVLARDAKHVHHKIAELENLREPFKIICGERIAHSNVVYRAPIGKYDAINFGASLIPEDVDIIVMNDVDTTIHNFGLALRYFSNKEVALVFGTEMVRKGPQNLFFKILNPIRKIIPIAASGELMLIRREVFERIRPLRPCKAEDTYILFKVLEYGHEVVFCEECYAETERTKSAEKEENYKRKTVTGIYQALSYSQPPPFVKLFYILLPAASPLLLLLGRRGYFWMRGILLGLNDFLRGDRTGVWSTAYME